MKIFCPWELLEIVVPKGTTVVPSGGTTPQSFPDHTLGIAVVEEAEVGICRVYAA